MTEHAEVMAAVEASLRKRLTDWLGSTSEFYARDRMSNDGGASWRNGLIGYLMWGPEALDSTLTASGPHEDPAFIHARWHRALDDPAREEPGPIRDHINQHDAEVLRAAADEMVGRGGTSPAARFLRGLADRTVAELSP